MKKYTQDRHDRNPRFSKSLSRLKIFYTCLTPVISCLLTVNTMLPNGTGSTGTDWNGTGTDKSRFRFVGCLEVRSCLAQQLSIERTQRSQKFYKVGFYHFFLSSPKKSWWKWGELTFANVGGLLKRIKLFFSVTTKGPNKLESLSSSGLFSLV